MSKQRYQEQLLTIGLVLILIGAPLVFWIISSKYEAESYNKLTGANVSTWDALWIELRVDANPRGLAK